MAKKKHKPKPQVPAPGDIPSVKDTKKNLIASKSEDTSAANDPVYPPFEFPSVSPPSIITEGSQGGPWRKKITDFTGAEDEKDFPMWSLDAVLNNRLPPRENTKYMTLPRSPVKKIVWKFSVFLKSVFTFLIEIDKAYRLCLNILL